MDTETLIGLIMMIVIGPAIGNYATSVVYRLPRAQTPFEKHPYCGSCNTLLQPKDLFPIWSYVFLRGRCRYCSVKIPAIHTVVELACGAIFIGNFLLLGFSENFILYSALFTFWVILSALEHQQRKLYPLILTFCFFLAAMPRLLADLSIYPMVQSSFILFFVLIVAWKISAPKTKHSAEQTGYRIPEWAIMAALAGITLPLPFAGAALILAGILYAIQRAVYGWKIASPAVGVAVWLMLLYAQSSSNL